ncbi:hypothetical protein GUITHDRAFT_112235 [Guillardia theta CCMP2712]|uniref:Uncharacterized protein n=1 Tax=Guillardia theta (strain CCMP2712) TaxID=905079 RepID=L1J0K2_GUITC|nr:hypothetical protein GUITHDRAFT_112235 [Guillardia theta CCMP2712]EKX41817.1 hypothetical protein GUITHDRAFT_112235 [Guillardia theta CCMP2712]|eukprot:XP_005828797.1 hypothetical protein GUITHDRAFT_112235 [Guillardia theta CCMP2712]
MTELFLNIRTRRSTGRTSASRKQKDTARQQDTATLAARQEHDARQEPREKQQVDDIEQEQLRSQLVYQQELERVLSLRATRHEENFDA